MTLGGSPGPTATTLLLVRHAETLDNVNLRLSGWTDTDLSPRGEAQVVLLADHFKNEHGHIDALYASPLIRARRTAEAIGRLTGHEPVLMDNLREMYFGELDGRPFEELREAYAHLLEADENSAIEDFVWPSGESRTGFTARVLRVTNTIARRHAGGLVGVVTHGGVIATLMTILHGESAAKWRQWVVPNASLTEIVWDSWTETGALIRHGDATHLGPLAAFEPTEPTPSDADITEVTPAVTPPVTPGVTPPFSSAEPPPSASENHKSDGSHDASRDGRGDASLLHNPD